jgi:hypothetical protein
MATVNVNCPYCHTGTTAVIPENSAVKDALQSYKTGIQKRRKLVEVSCSEGHHFGVTYE